MRRPEKNPKKNSTILGARSNMCIHPMVSTLPSTKVDNQCRTLVSRRECPYHQQAMRADVRENIAQAPLVDLEDLIRCVVCGLCVWWAGANTLFVLFSFHFFPLFLLFSYSNQHFHACPYFVTRELQKEV